MWDSKLIWSPLDLWINKVRVFGTNLFLCIVKNIPLFFVLSVCCSSRFKRTKNMDQFMKYLQHDCVSVVRLFFFFFEILIFISVFSHFFSFFP